MGASRLLVAGIGCLIDFADAASSGPIVRSGVDLLIENGRIAEVGAGLAVGDAEIIDASQRVVLPGFVDTHRHLWLTALRALTTETDLAGYLERLQARPSFARVLREAEPYFGMFPREG